MNHTILFSGLFAVVAAFAVSACSDDTTGGAATTGGPEAADGGPVTLDEDAAEAPEGAEGAPTGEGMEGAEGTSVLDAGGKGDGDDDDAGTPIDAGGGAVADGGTGEDDGGGWAVPLAYDGIEVTGFDGGVEAIFTPIDNPIFDINPAEQTLVTSYYTEAVTLPGDSVHFLRLYDGVAVAYQTEVQGEGFAPSEYFCADTDWCQLIGFDGVSSRFAVFGIASPAILWLTQKGDIFTGERVPITGDARAGMAWYISQSHAFAWAHRKAYTYGALGPKGNMAQMVEYDLDSGAVRLVSAALPPVADNCLVADGGGKIYSLGGYLSVDGETSEATHGYLVIDPATGAFEERAMGMLETRTQQACAYDPKRNRIYAFGGVLPATLHADCQGADAPSSCYISGEQDQYMTFFNGLWALDVGNPEAGWTKLIAETTGGFLDMQTQFGKGYQGDPTGPNFGPHRGFMMYDAGGDRLFIGGDVANDIRRLFEVKLAP